MGTYTDIQIIGCPSEVKAGQLVCFSTNTDNLDTETRTIQTLVLVEGLETLFDEAEDLLPGINPHDHSFIMPNQEVHIGAYTFVLGDDGYYHYDDYDTAYIDLLPAEEAYGISAMTSMINMMVLPMMLMAVMAPMAALLKGGKK